MRNSRQSTGMIVDTLICVLPLVVAKLTDDQMSPKGRVRKESAYMNSNEDLEDDGQAIAALAQKSFRNAREDAIKKGRIRVYARDGVLYRESPGEPAEVIGKTEPAVRKPVGGTTILR